MLEDRLNTIGRRRGRPGRSAADEAQPTIQAVDRALDVLSVLAAQDGATLSELAGRLGQSVATMHRLLASLAAREMVEVDPASQAWHIGPEAFRLGSSFLRRSNVIERSRPIMRELTAETRETSNLGIEWNGQVLFVGQVETHEFIRAFFRPGTLSPLHASGIGKALLSAYEPVRVDAILRDARFEGFTERTIASRAELMEELELTRRRGFAFDNEERAKGMRCIAAPVLNGFREAVAGISISGPSERIPEAHVEAIGNIVRAAANRVSALLGA